MTLPNCSLKAKFNYYKIYYNRTWHAKRVASDFKLSYLIRKACIRLSPKWYAWDNGEALSDLSLWLIWIALVCLYYDFRDMFVLCLIYILLVFVIAIWAICNFLLKIITTKNSVFKSINFSCRQYKRKCKESPYRPDNDPLRVHQEVRIVNAKKPYWSIKISHPSFPRESLGGLVGIRGHLIPFRTAVLLCC